jgi:acetyl esterase/lipase
MVTNPVKRETQPFVLPVWPGDAPGSENWTWHEVDEFVPAPFNLQLVRNVTRPTLTAFLPDPAEASGAAVIICPGGAHHVLAFRHEGLQVAEWLCKRGVAAFVLKYRLIHTPDAVEDYLDYMNREMQSDDNLPKLARIHGPLACADGQQAVRLVRRRAAEWNLSPDRIGIMGFSAGGHVTAEVAQRHDAESRPNFAAPIYGALWEDLVVPADAPPLFMALANDDDITVEPSLRLHSAWRQAGHPVEIHIYANGGHGFGMNHTGNPSDGWIERFYDWLQTLG